jgi:hypothetical protein
MYQSTIYIVLLDQLDLVHDTVHTAQECSCTTGPSQHVLPEPRNRVRVSQAGLALIDFSPVVAYLMYR